MNNPVYAARAEMLIRKPVREVFEAFINPDITTNFWFTKSSGPVIEGAEIIWTWEMYNLDVPVSVKQVVTDQLIKIDWGEGVNRSSARWDFRPLSEDKTFVVITNDKFLGEGDTLVQQIKDSTGGFTLVLAGLKSWLEHGVVLNLVGDKFPQEMMK